MSVRLCGWGCVAVGTPGISTSGGLGNRNSLSPTLHFFMNRIIILWQPEGLSDCIRSRQVPLKMWKGEIHALFRKCVCFTHLAARRYVEQRYRTLREFGTWNKSAFLFTLCWTSAALPVGFLPEVTVNDTGRCFTASPLWFPYRFTFSYFSLASPKSELIRLEHYIIFHKRTLS